MAELPKISIVIPSYNGGKTLAAAIRSVLDQDYPAKEVIVVDGGSKDDSAEIIRSFAPRLTWWVSEKDQGQADAINKGFAHATGDVINWLCCDDELAPGALRRVGTIFRDRADVDVVLGVGSFIYHEKGDLRTVGVARPDAVEALPGICAIAQPSCFYRRSLAGRRATVVDAGLHYAMDLELWAYFKSVGARWEIISDVLSIAHISGENKTSVAGVKAAREYEDVYRRYVKERVSLAFWYRTLLYPLDRFRGKRPSALRHGLTRAAKATIMVFLVPFYGLRRVRSINWSHHV